MMVPDSEPFFFLKAALSPASGAQLLNRNYQSSRKGITLNAVLVNYIRITRSQPCKLKKKEKREESNLGTHHLGERMCTMFAPMELE